MRVLLTGGDGFLGRHVQAALSSHALTVPPRTPGAAPHYALEEEGCLPPLLAAARPEAVVHLAAQASVAASFAAPLACWRANLLGTLALAEAVRRETPGARFLFASSAEVYGLSFQAGAPLAEDAPLAPANPYAASKAAADLALGEMALRGLAALRLRFFNLAGPGQSEGFVVADICRQIARIEAGLDAPPLRVGALDRWRDFLDVRDAARALALALAAEWPPGLVLNIAAGQPRRIGDVLEALLARARCRPEVEVAAARLRPTDVARVAGDAGRARALLGWAPEIPWERTLDEALAEWRARVARGEG
ncbi:GDP-mannose 4,6-dehydratase [Rubritepida flocculans]|uniref:GDP-mannose 4,6-dehydratase n=1 Tax=Rubritepida flocculans TaxID=182403 RepID=UPI00040538F4|nr:GDP-mannose 4,6-dehydratase [Rubritepida flocculans]